MKNPNGLQEALISAAPELLEALKDAVRWLWGAYQENDSLMLDAMPVNCMNLNEMRRIIARAESGPERDDTLGIEESDGQHE